MTKLELIRAISDRMTAAGLKTQRAGVGPKSVAQALLAYDIALHVEAAASLLEQRLWSPATSLRRLILERTEYLEAAGYDESFAQNYLETKHPDAKGPGRAGGQRSSMRAGWIRDGLSELEARAFLDAHRELSDLASASIHPRALMPSFHFQVEFANGSPDATLSLVGSAVALAGLSVFTSTPTVDRRLADVQQLCALSAHWIEEHDGVPVRELIGPDLVVEIDPDGG